MQYRTLTRDKIKVSALGFGCMRLPMLKNGKVSRREAVAMIRHGIDSGINYLDTAYPYHQKYLHKFYRRKTDIGEDVQIG